MKWVYKPKWKLIAECNDLQEDLKKIKEQKDDAEDLLKEIRDRANNRWYDIGPVPDNDLGKTLEQRELEYIILKINLWLGRQ